MNWIRRTLKNDLWIIVLDICAVNLAYYVALVLRGYINHVGYPYGGTYAEFVPIYIRFAPLYTILCLIVFYFFRLYGGIWRYAGISDINRIIGANIVTCIIHILGSLLFFQNSAYRHMPITYYGLGAIFQFLLISCIRFFYRIVIVEKRKTNKKLGTALVIGNEEFGRQTARILQEGIYYRVACIVDPGNVAVGRIMDGLPVYGLDQIEEAIAKHSITCVFLAEPNLEEQARKGIIELCNEQNVVFRDYSSIFGFEGEVDQLVGMESVIEVSKSQTGNRKIPFSPPDIGEAEISEVVETLRSGWITTGPRTKLLERRLAAYIETGKTDIDTESEIDRWKERVVCLNSATSSEELNLRVFGIRPGDEVIVPAYTYTASASAAVHCGATIKFVDIQKDGDPITHMPEMDYDKLEAAITEKTKAIVAVDLGGIVCDYDRIFEIVEKKRGLFKPFESDGSVLGDLSSRIQHAIGRVAVVCDAAHALGASRIVSHTGQGVVEEKKRYVGAIADFTSFSFHAVKNFTTAEGGASTWIPIAGVENAEIYKMYQLLSLHGQNKDALAKTKIGAWEYDIIGPWYKCNMTDIMAAIGLRQLDRYLGLLERREQMMKEYDKTCEDLGFSHIIHHVSGMDSSNHLYLIRILGINEEQRNEIIEKMAIRGVATNVHYKPMPMMTAYGKDCSAYPNAYDYYHNLITLPFHTKLSDDDIIYVCENLKAVINEMGI